MKKLFLSISLLTLAFGLVPFKASAVSLTAEEKASVDELTSAEDLTTSCSEDLSAEEYTDCLAAEAEDYSNTCTEDLEEDPSSKCYIDLDSYVDSDETVEDEPADDDAEIEDEDFLAGFTEEEAEEEEGEPASIVPVIVATVLGLVAIIGLNLAGKKK